MKAALRRSNAFQYLELEMYSLIDGTLKKNIFALIKESESGVISRLQKERRHAIAIRSLAFKGSCLITAEGAHSHNQVLSTPRYSKKSELSMVLLDEYLFLIPAGQTCMARFLHLMLICLLRRGLVPILGANIAKRNQNNFLEDARRLYFNYILHHNLNLT
jgi:hypothetical protein